MRTFLIEARKKAGLKQIQLAAMLGKYKNFVWKYEHGERRLDFVEVEEILRKLNIDSAQAVREIGVPYAAEDSPPSPAKQPSAKNRALKRALPK